MICHRDSKFTAQFKRIIKDARVDVILTPPQAPNSNAFTERFVLSECGRDLINIGFFFGASACLAR